MAISFNNIPYGLSINQEKSKYEATRRIVSDGNVDAAFVSQTDNFISTITDPRVQAFAKDNSVAPGENWKPHELGGFDSANQSLFLEEGKVVLRSNTEEQGKKIQHHIKAPYDATTGAVILESSGEGFQFAREAGGKSATFNIPLSAC